MEQLKQAETFSGQNSNHPKLFILEQQFLVNPWTHAFSDDIYEINFPVYKGVPWLLHDAWILQKHLQHPCSTTFPSISWVEGRPQQPTYWMISSIWETSSDFNPNWLSASQFSSMESVHRLSLKKKLSSSFIHILHSLKIQGESLLEHVDTSPNRSSNYHWNTLKCEHTWGIFVGQPCMYLPSKASNLGASHQEGDRIIFRNERQIYRAINVVFNIYNKFM